MAHKTLIGGTSYNVKSGRTLINGTGYNVKKGIALIDGSKHIIDFGTPIGEFAVKTSVFTDFDNVRTEFIIVNQGNPDSSIYDDTANGTWLLIKDIYEIDVKYRASSGQNSLYTDSLLPEKMQSYLEKFSEAIQQTIKTINLPCNGYNNAKDVVTLSCKLFPLSAAELSVKGSYSAFNDGAVLQMFSDNLNSTRIAKYNNTAKRYWTRTGQGLIQGSNSIYIVTDDGDVQTNRLITDGHSEHAGTRFAFLVPSETLVDLDFNIIPA